MSHVPQAKYLIPIQAPSEPSSNPANDQFREFCRLMKSIPYVDNAHLDRLGVTCEDIDFETGAPADGYPKLIDLVPAHQSDAIIEQTDIGQDNAVPATADYPSKNVHEARFVGYFFLYGLFGSISPDSNTPVLDCSPWVILERRPDTIISSFHGFHIVFTLELGDKSLPDIMCFLANDTPCKDEELYTSELLCIMQFGLRRLRAKRYHGHHHIAVTIASGSGRKVRIVQGYVDKNKGCVFVRKSKFVDLNGNRGDNLRRLMQIHRWILGQPCRE
ncbi:hypothetical protein F5Y04DRAFT_267310 [Hypomontagnella monticulosa]|nr:hypothetical protein F5Y04DRAFT_267310 [Hypomontagnella monticulosa]